MHLFVATVHTIGLRLLDRARSHVRTHVRAAAEDGSVTVEQVVVTLMLAGLVVAVGVVLKGYISSKLAGLN